MLRVLPIAALLALIIAAAAPIAGAHAGLREDVVVSGRVTSSATGAPLAGALVSVARTSRSVLTGSNGEYRLTIPADALPGGDVRIVASYLGFAQADVSIGTRPSGLLRVDIQLNPNHVALDEVVAVGYGQNGVRSAPYSPMIAPVGYSVERFATGGAFVQWNTENYAHISENRFRSASDAPLSTFSIDVDRASYSNVRRFLLDGQLPPVDAVRVEELVNYFSYDYPTTRGEHPFAVTTELGPAPWTAGHQILRIGLASQPVPLDNLPPSNFVFLIDVSGSMSSPDRLPLAKQALRLLVDQLRPRDRVAIVVYAGAAGLALPSTPGDRKGVILDAIESLEAGGSTAGGEGLRLAYRIAAENHVRGGNNRVILASDGDFNVGVSSDSEMVRLVSERRAQGTYLTILGFGRGNLQDSKMEQMAQHGNGNYAYIDSLLEARKVLVTEMGGTLLTVASDVKLQVEFNPARVSAYRLIGYENRLLAPEDFNDDQRDAGELGAGHVVTALYEIVPAGVDSPVTGGAIDPLRYQQAAASPATAGSPDEVAFVRARYKQPGTERSILLEQAVQAAVGRPTPDFDFATAVAGFGMLLRDSEHRGSIDVSRILELARRGRGSDEHGHRAEFIQLVELYGGVKDRIGRTTLLEGRPEDR